MKAKRDKPNFGPRQISVNQLMTIEQCAELLQVTVGSIYVWVSHKQIPFRKLGPSKNAAVRFDYDEIVEWTKRCLES